MLCFAILAAALPLQAALPKVQPPTQSSSGQFVVYGPRPTPGHPTQNDQLADDMVLQLETDLLAITCERIKRAFLTELQQPDRWRGRVTMRIETTWSGDRPIQMDSGWFSDGWRYQVSLPPQVSYKVLVRNVTELLLQEFANRTAGQRAAEIPFWLAEGMSRHLLAAYKQELFLRPQTRSSINTVRTDPLERVRAHFSTNQPLTINDLSLPGQAELSASGGLTYSYSAQLLYFEWSRYYPTREPVAHYLSRSGSYLNWQSAFLESYQSAFPRMLDFEKWWAITVVNFTGRDPNRAWKFPETLRRLEEILRTPARISIQARAGPQPGFATLQQLITQWDPVQHHVLIRQKLTQLQLLRTQSAPELLPVVEEYRKTLESYVTRRQRAGFASGVKGQVLPSVALLIQETVRRLDDLDARKSSIQPAPR